MRLRARNVGQRVQPILPRASLAAPFGSGFGASGYGFWLTDLYGLSFNL